MVTLFSAALGQGADIRLTIERTDPLELSWVTASVTQPGSISIIPDTQLETSTDLIHWQVLGQSQTGGLDTPSLTVSRIIETTADPCYFRIRSQVNLPNADLTKHNLVAADLRGANLSDANLANTDLALAKLDGADLTGANLTGVNFAEAVLGSVNFTDANLTGATTAPWHHFPETVYRNTTLPDGTIKTDTPERRLLIKLYVDGAPKVELAGRDFSGWDLRGVELQNRNLAKCNFTGTDLRNTKLAGANLTLANLLGATGFEPVDHEAVILHQTTLPDGTVSD
ncbi:MAG: pentapeptide repeat-containing protein [Verrucomicrobiota bacterium]|nr:pentapeptide repeat-containing protein [Verrucomicrobiota bacterium]